MKATAIAALLLSFSMASAQSARNTHDPCESMDSNATIRSCYAKEQARECRAVGWSRNEFDTATPVGSNYEAAPSGAMAGPPAPPRDGDARIGDLFECFDF